MKTVAVISDIHGNTWALESVLADISKRNVDLIFNLGDSLYGPLDPVGTFALLKQYTIHHISGNEDRLILDFLHKKTRNKTLSYVTENINEEIINWLTSLKFSLIVDDFFLCHGTPIRDDDYLIEHVYNNHVELRKNEDILRMIGTRKEHVVCCGHSHMYNLIQLKKNHYVINPGSVGLQAYDDHSPFYHKMEGNHNKASYCIITKNYDDYLFDHIMVPYDWKLAVQCALKNNNRDWVHWLSLGQVQK